MNTAPRLSRLLHWAFEGSLLLKGFFAVAELLGGLILYLTGANTIVEFIRRVTLEELSEDPNDGVAQAFLRLAQTFSIETKDFYAFYLAGHGIVKLFLVLNLLRGVRWAYPAALTILPMFVVYQLYRYSYTHSIGLVFLSVFDVIMIALIWREYRLNA